MVHGVHKVVIRLTFGVKRRHKVSYGIGSSTKGELTIMKAVEGN